MSQEKVKLSAFIVVASILVSGCGAEDGPHPKFVEDQRVRSIIRQFQSAITKDRGGCLLLTESLERSRASAGGGCDINGFTDIARVRQFDVTIPGGGDEAIAELEGVGRIKLQRVDGESGDDWRISSLPTR
jgi:hypothetical protein